MQKFKTIIITMLLLAAPLTTLANPDQAIQDEINIQRAFDTSTEREIDDFFRNMANEMAQDMPINLNRNVRMTSIQYISGLKELHYSMAIRVKKDKIKPAELEQFKAVLKKDICETPNTRVFVKNGIGIHYSVNDISNDHIVNILINTCQ